MNDKLAREEFERKISGLEKEIENLRRMADDFQKKEERYAKAEEICNYGHWSRDFTTGKGGWSKNVYRIFGVSPDDFDPTFENFFRLVHPDDRALIKDATQQAVSKCKSIDFIYRVICPDKIEKIIRSVAEPVADPQGCKKQLFGTIQDITEWKIAEEALHKGEQQFATIFHLNPAAIAISRIKDNRLVEINRAWEKKLGISRGEAIGRTTFELKIWDNPEVRSKFILELCKDGEIRGTEAKIITRNGEVLYFLMSGRCINFEEEKCLLTIAQDITEQKILFNRLKESEQLYRSIFENSLIGISQILPEGKAVSANDALAKMFGYETTQELLSCITDTEKQLYVDPEEKKAVWKELFRDGHLNAREVRLKKRDGTFFTVLVSANEIRDAEGKVKYYQAAYLDITERKKMEEELGAASRYNRSLIEVSLDPLVTINADGKVMDVNKATEQATGVPREKLIGSDFCDYFTKPEKARKGYRQVFSKGIVKDYPLSIRHISGTITDVLYNASVYKNEAGEVHGVFAARDITERLKIDQERERLQTELFQAQKMKSLGTLVAGVAHEINNPISTILNNAPLLQKVWNDVQSVIEKYAETNPHDRYGGLAYEFIKDNLSQLISDIEISADRVATIAKGLRDFSRKTTSYEKEPVNINTAVENAVRLAGSSLHNSGIALTIDRAPDLPAIIANQQNLEQIVLNLVVNATQAIQHDHGKIRIATSYSQEDDMIILSVEDNGKGIDPSIADKIFDPFFTERQKNGGTGLGLSITHNLVKANNGDISFDSKKGKGTVFHVSFPVRPAYAPARILIADDDEGILKVIEKVLVNERQYIIEKACNGNEALIKIGIFSPDLLLLDIFMPEMDGVEVIRAIKNQPELDDMKIIVISGHTEHEKITQVIEMGVFKVLSKPINRKELLMNVEEAVKER